MKFTLVFKRSKGTEDFFEQFAGKNFAKGVALVRLDKVDIVDKSTGEFCKPAYALRCKSSYLNYLRFKDDWKASAVVPGWKR